jgi:cellulose synthase/poly-beta-1,6-N-acetylglucosamine synthase-like glycosyltransferase
MMAAAMSPHRRPPSTRRRDARRPRKAGASVLALAAATVAAPSAYLSVITALGVLPRRPTTRPDPPTTRFAILVPAHDEAAGIGPTLRAFTMLDYPTDLFSVHVVADNCADETAEVVRHAGWAAHDRSAPDDPGKGPALNWLFDRLVAQGVAFDAVVVVDADTTIDPDFLRAMDHEVRAGVDAAQGYYSVRDADRSAAASFRFAALACRHHLRPLGRSRLGGSCGLYGNGMMFTRATLAGRRWSGHLVEDAELQNEMLLDGELVTYVPEAVLWAEMPDTLEDASSQNERWERGRIEMAIRYVPKLLAGLGGARGRRVARIDAVCDHLVPPLSVLAAWTLVVAVVHAIGAALGHRASRVALAVDGASLLALVAHTFAGLASVGAPPSRYRALLSAPKIMVWKVALWRGALRPDREVGWTRTSRNIEAHR